MRYPPRPWFASATREFIAAAMMRLDRSQANLRDCRRFRARNWIDLMIIASGVERQS